MGKRGGEKIRVGKGSYNPRANNNKIEKRIEKEKRQHPLRIVSSVLSNSLIPNSSSASTVSGYQHPYHGYIFMCNGKTKTDCFKYRVFGLPAARVDVLNKIHPQMKLFLFDFDLRLLYGIFIPASKGEMSLEPAAFGGRFSAQVRFEIYEDCLPLPESVFKPIIRDNYQGSKFCQELSKEHVENLISLFCPVAMSPSQVAVSFPAAISLEQSDKPPGFEVYSGPGTGLSDSHCQDFAGQHVLQAEPPRHSQHMPQREKLSHASVAKFQSMSHPTVRAHPQLQQYYSSEAHPTYFSSLPEQELYNRYAALPRDNQVTKTDRNVVAQAHSHFPSQLSTPSHGHGHLPTKSLSAAYWISVANDSLQKEMYRPLRQSTPSGNTGMAVSSQTPPIEKETPIIFQHPPAEIDDNSPAAATPAVVQPPAEYRPTHLQTSSSLIPENWTAVTSQDPNQVYSVPTQWQQVASLGLCTNNASTSVQTGLAPGFYTVPETGANQYVPNTGATFDYYHYYSTKTGTDGVPVQAHDSAAVYYSSTLSVPAQAHDPTAAFYSANFNFPIQGGNLAAHNSATTGAQAYDPAAAYYYANTGIPAQAHDVSAYYAATPGIPGQAHGQGAYYIPENSHGHTSSLTPAYWDSNLVGAARFPQSILPSGNSSTSVGGEHMTVSLPGAAATIGPVYGL